MQPLPGPWARHLHRTREHLGGDLADEESREPARDSYYDIPREASHEDVATAIGCAPSTAAEHLRKVGAKLLRSVLGN